MGVTSLSFVGFTLIVLIIYYFLPRRPQNILLLVASYGFLASFAWEFVAVFIALTAVNFALALRVKGNIWMLRLGILMNVLALAVFKYADFFVPEVEDILGVGTGSLKILLPIGLSFYILQAISYLMDIEKGLLEPEPDPIDFALYMAYFPRLTSGPIERARDFLPKLKENRIVDDDVLARSFTLILLGAFRKIALADVLTVMIPEDVFSDPKNYQAPALVIWLLVYSFALYNDFAGYTQLVRGVSGLFGIELSSNFNTPYLARNFVEFWQRWHITLSEWLRDYIFTPLTRGLLRRKYNSRHALTVIAPPMITMLVSGLWHNASFNMLVWGGLHGVFQVLERARSIWRPSPPPQEHPAWRQVGAMAIVFILAALAWVPFRTPMPQAVDYWGGLVNVDQWSKLSDFEWEHVYIIGLILVIVTLTMDIVQYRWGELAYLKLHPLAKAILINIAIFAMIAGTVTLGDIPPPFIYQGF